MIWFRLLTLLVIYIAIAYYAMVLLHCLGMIKFTNRKITFGRLIIPFYYWIAPTNEKPSNK